jgi:hypothetical protein
VDSESEKSDRTTKGVASFIVPIMKKRSWIILAAALVVAGGIGVYWYQRSSIVASGERAELLAMMPPDASVVFYADALDLRNSAFLAELYQWAPQVPADPEYTQFLGETGFDYERDLKRVAVAITKGTPDNSLFAVADGNFDEQKIKAYALQAGGGETHPGREIFSIPESSSTRKISFTFLQNNRIALTNEPGRFADFGNTNSNIDRGEWQIRFERVAGSPLFAVIRQDHAAGSALAEQKFGGLESPQLSALLNQLQWISLAGKPQGNSLRIIADGECSVERTARQLTDLLNGVVLLAQSGLNAPQNRKELDPAARQAYLEILKTADISYIDRGDTKSVRLVLDVTPKLLEVSRTAQLPAAASPPETKQSKVVRARKTRRQK